MQRRLGVATEEAWVQEGTSALAVCDVIPGTRATVLCPVGAAFACSSSDGVLVHVAIPENMARDTAPHPAFRLIISDSTRFAHFSGVCLLVIARFGKAWQAHLTLI
jgi:hypothetical protein